ncbi:hypothetical protein [Agrobacterium tumefaciens]|uniref:hypothetical protein n=1 Tax=Agrobacterium tumefaciens TaxID=358 RepID=UPI001F1D9943
MRIYTQSELPCGPLRGYECRNAHGAPGCNETVSERWDAIGVNGTEREKALAVEIAAEHGFELTNPELQEKLAAARQKIETQRAAEASREAKRLGFVEGASASAAQKTDAEIAIGLETVRERTQTEARREVNQAQTSSGTRERPFDGGGDDHVYRTKSEASAARSAKRSVEQNPGMAMPADINQSPEIVAPAPDTAKQTQTEAVMLFPGGIFSYLITER